KQGGARDAYLSIRFAHASHGSGEVVVGLLGLRHQVIELWGLEALPPLRGGPHGNPLGRGTSGTYHSGAGVALAPSRRGAQVRLLVERTYSAGREPEADQQSTKKRPARGRAPGNRAQRRNPQQSETESRNHEGMPIYVR